MILRDRIIAASKSWVGAPYVHGGRDRRGVDCLGYIFCVAWDCGIAWPDVPSDMDKRKLLEGLARNAGRRKHPEDMRSGDLLVVMLDPSTTHLAIASKLNGQHSMIHAYDLHYKVVEHNIDSYWRSKLRMVHDFCPNVDHDVH